MALHLIDTDSYLIRIRCSWEHVFVTRTEFDALVLGVDKLEEGLIGESMPDDFLHYVDLFNLHRIADYSGWRTKILKDVHDDVNLDAAIAFVRYMLAQRQATKRRYEFEHELTKPPEEH